LPNILPAVFSRKTFFDSLHVRWADCVTVKSRVCRNQTAKLTIANGRPQERLFIVPTAVWAKSKDCRFPRLIVADYHRFQNASTEINYVMRSRTKPSACLTPCTTYIKARGVPKAGILLEGMLPPGRRARK
jgi:hypothetical protein